MFENNINLNLYKVFYDVAKYGSFSKAAEELSYTPSAMSHIADSVECELGIKLLNRNFNGVELNENGTFLLPYIKALINAEDELLKQSKKLENKSHHLLE